MIWQCPNGCTGPIALPDDSSVVCGYCRLEQDFRPIELRVPGVGDILRRRFRAAGKMIKWLRLPCACAEVQAKLNSLTPPECRERQVELLEDVLASGRRSGMPVDKPLIRPWIARQLDRSIAEAQRHRERAQREGGG
jgi:chorismate mutase